MSTRVLPDAAELRRLSRYMTQVQLAEHYGVSTRAVEEALRRAGLTDSREAADTIPWRVRREHIHVYPATMLRYLARRDRGEELTAREDKLLTAWLGKLDAGNLVVYYHPSVPPNAASPAHGGWAYVPRLAVDGEPIERGDDEPGARWTSYVRQPPEALKRPV